MFYYECLKMAERNSIECYSYETHIPKFKCNSAKRPAAV